MKIREYDEKDLKRVVELYRQDKKEFALPDPADARVAVKKCLVDSRGRIRLVGFGRLQLNAYLLVDGKWKTPAERLEAIEILEFAMIQQAKTLGFDQATAQVEPPFGRRLRTLGWHESMGQTYSREF